MTSPGSGQTLANRRRLLDRYLRDVDAARPDHIVPRQASGPLPLSHAQERLWLAQQVDPNGTTYNERAAVCLRGPLSYAACRAAVALIVERHEVLRTVFPIVDGTPCQVVHDARVDVARVDLRPIAPDQRDAAFRRVAWQLGDQPFDLTAGPLLRPMLVRIAEDTHLFVVAAHHIAFDLWSARLFLREWAETYAAIVERRDPALPALPIQYADYARWDRERTKTGAVGGAIGEALDTLARRLSNVPALELPARPEADRARPGRTRCHAQVLNGAVSDGLRRLAAESHTSLSNVLLAALQALLYRYTAQREFGIGLPVANRHRGECRDLIGLFVNTVVFRATLADDPPFLDLLHRTTRHTEEAYAFQHVPYEALVQRLQPDRRAGAAALFRVVWAYQDVPEETWNCRDVRMSPAPRLDPAFTLFDLESRAWDAADGIHLHLIANADTLEAATIDHLLPHFERLLTQLAAGDVQVRLSDMAMLSEAERRQLTAWNQTTRVWPTPALVHDGIAAQARRRPDAIALVCEATQISYAALERHANQLANELRELGVTLDVRVGLCVERGVELIVGLLGILKAGATYVPLDAQAPAARTTAMLDAAQVSVLVTTDALLARLPATWAQQVCLDRDGPRISRQPASAPAPRLCPENLAYVMFTSGSTGRPKGVAVTHAGVRNLAAAQIEGFGIDEGSAVLQFASVSFDAATSEWTTALLAGARLVLASQEALRPGRELIDTLDRHRIDTVTLPPSVLASLPVVPLPALRTLVVAGEAVSSELVRTWSRGRVLLNAYGPTEVTVCATLSCALDGQAPITIGRALANADVHVVDRDCTVVPIGVPGELCVGGVGLARGYIGQPALTAERFVPHPFGTAGARLYRTGDRVRRRADGQLEFLGRFDDQVKWRGYRIEPREIESILASHPAIRQSAVLLREDQPGDARLIAYVIPSDMAATDEALRRHVRAHLPEHMVPSAFVRLAQWPLTPTGKLDREALPRPDASATPPPVHERPRTPLEDIVGGIWCDILGRESVARRANFFDLGGHSLLATRVIARLRAALDIELPLRAMFDTPTVADIAAAIEAARLGGAASDAPPVRVAARSGPLPLSFAQQRVWFLDQLDPGTSLYNCHGAVRLTGPLDVARLRRALTAIVARHEILRTCFPAPAGEPVQEIAAPAPVPLCVIDLTAFAASTRERMAHRLADRQAARPFDLSRGPLLRAGLLRLNADEHILLLTLHHIVSDGWSLGILIREVGALYDRASVDAPTSALPALPLQYADFAVWQREWLRPATLEPQVRYWRAKLADVPALALPLDAARPPHPSGRGATLAWTPARALDARITEVSRQQGVTPFMTLLAAFQVLLGRYAGQTDVAVGTDVANRTRVEVEDLIGFFVNQLVLRTDLGGNPSFVALLARVRETTLEAYEHQDLPFEMVVEQLTPVRDTSRSPLFQVSLVLQNVPHTALALQDLKIELLARRRIAAKHDLSLILEPTESGLVGELEYATDLFDRTTMRRLLDQLDTLLTRLLDAPDRAISEASLLTDGERARLLSWGNERPLDRQQARRVERLIDEQARRTPDAIAVVQDDDHVSYGELTRRANQLARQLAARGLGPEAPIGIALGRQTRGVIALLGVLRARAVAVLVDPDYPATRLARIINDARLLALIAPPAIAGAPSLTRIDLDEAWPALDLEDDRPLPIDAEGAALAYVMYTSGSTGVPKGVGIAHDALDTYVQAIVPALGLSGDDRILQLASWGFDVLIEELLPALTRGAAVVLAPDAWFTRGLDVATLIARQQVTGVEVTTAYWQQWVAEATPASMPACLRFVIVGGERIAPASVRAWQRLGIPLVHVYGLTETAITSTVHHLSTDAAAIDLRREFPIGAPLAHASVYVLDAEGAVAPIGVPGELYVGGPGVARGYVHQPALTAARFLPDHIGGGGAGQRLYRTGDRARWRADGTLEILGRVDAQVKVRGYRIEPAEVEQVLVASPLVREAAVIAQPDVSGRTGLVAYVTPAAPETFSVGTLRAALGERLPAYMVPDTFVILEALPMTPHGKVDRRTLAARPPAHHASPPDERPRTPVEATVAEIWCELLGRAGIGIHENFFEIGGHSLLATQLISRIRRSFATDLPLRCVFEGPTIADLACQIVRTEAAGCDETAALDLLMELEAMSEADARARLMD